MSIAISPPYLLGQAFPLFTLRRTSNLHNSDLDCTSHPLPLFNISSDNFGSLYYNLGPSTQLKPACRLQYVTRTWPRDPASPMPQNMNIAKILNKEKSNKKYLESQCSDQWRKHLELTLSDPPGGRVRAYVHWHLHNKHKRSMYKPAPYPTHPSCPYQLELLRLRTQHTIHTIPSHLHYTFKAPRADYHHWVCKHCLDKGTTVLGDEIHIICHCPATKALLHQFTAKFQGLTRLLDLPPFASFTPHEKTRMVLGYPPLQVLKGLKGWIRKQLQSAVSLHMPSACMSLLCSQLL